MAELTTQERLQPSLLDRLTDHEPSKTKETREQRVFSTRRLKESVLRDLSWLLNTTNLFNQERSEENPEAARSVVNFGIPDLAGITASTVNSSALARLLREAILNFEPRILRDSLQVEVQVGDDEMNQNNLRMKIEGELWAVPVPLHLLVNTAVDLESGTVVVTDQSGTGR